MPVFPVIAYQVSRHFIVAINTLRLLVCFQILSICPADQGFSTLWWFRLNRIHSSISFGTGSDKSFDTALLRQNPPPVNSCWHMWTDPDRQSTSRPGLWMNGLPGNRQNWLHFLWHSNWWATSWHPIKAAGKAGTVSIDLGLTGEGIIVQ